MTYLPKALRFDDDAMTAVILAIGQLSWNPQFVVAHNTAIPDLPEWLHYTPGQKQSWGDNLNSGYKKMGWHSGPHLCATPDFTYQLCDLSADGVHASCWNHIAYGVENIGNFCTGGDDPNSVAAVATIAKWINALAALHVRFNWDPAAYKEGVSGLHFHKECLHDNHACPGALIDKATLVREVAARMDIIAKSGIKPNAAPPFLPSPFHAEPTPMPVMVVLPEWPPAGDPFFEVGARCINKWVALGWPLHQAFGLTANPEAECSLSIPIALAGGDSGMAKGFFQWWPPRRAAIKAGCGIDVAIDTLVEHQIEAANWELHNTERPAMMKIAATMTAGDAGTACAVFYCRAGAPLAAQKRYAMAERWAVFVQNNPGFLAANPPLA